MLKSCGVVVGGGGLQHFSVSPRPLGFGFGTKGFGGKGLGPGLDKKMELDLTVFILFYLIEQLAELQGRNKIIVKPCPKILSPKTP